jgi:transcriptional regulator with XRE-family HTH domain
MSTIQDRLRMIMKMHNLNSSAFADRIGVQRSSISHILSGRNKPSMDFIEKTLAEFPRVNADWLITGSMTAKSSVDNDEQSTSKNIDIKPERVEVRKEMVKKRSIVRVVVYFDDGTYEESYPNKEQTSAE